MKITKDSKGTLLLNNGRHRVILSPEVVQAIAEHVYAEAPRSEVDGRMVVVDLGEVAAGESEPIDALTLPACSTCGVPAELASVQEAKTCALRCPMCGSTWVENLSDLVIRVLLGDEGAEGDGDHATGYGAFPGGDPRLFSPDTEVCTPGEIAAHAKACEEAQAMEDRGEVPDWPPSHRWESTEHGAAHIASEPFGVGTY